MEMKYLILFAGLFFAGGAYAQSTVELPPGGSTTVGATTVICMKSRIPVCRIHRADDHYEIRSDDEVLIVEPNLNTAIAWLRHMRQSGACQ
jgi:hypothetical protein